jgi:hypothetical protein
LNGSPPVAAPFVAARRKNAGLSAEIIALLLPTQLQRVQQETDMATTKKPAAAKATKPAPAKKAKKQVSASPKPKKAMSPKDTVKLLARANAVRAERVANKPADPTAAPTAKAEPKPAKAAKPAKGAKTAPAKADKAAERGPNKTDAGMALLRRPEGATNAEIAEANGWLPHTTRAWVSTLPKKKGISVVNEVEQGRGRVYRIAA